MKRNEEAPHFCLYKILLHKALPLIISGALFIALSLNLQLACTVLGAAFALRSLIGIFLLVFSRHGTAGSLFSFAIQAAALAFGIIILLCPLAVSEISLILLIYIIFEASLSLLFEIFLRAEHRYFAPLGVFRRSVLGVCLAVLSLTGAVILLILTLTRGFYPIPCGALLLLEGLRELLPRGRGRIEKPQGECYIEAEYRDAEE